jgi:hypothetical protein
MTAFPFAKHWEPLQGQEARPVLWEAPGSWPCARLSGLQGQEVGGREASLEIIRIWADNSEGGISLGCDIYHIYPIYNEGERGREGRRERE